MTAEDKLKVVLREMTAIGRGWRISWFDFDGRTLRNQLDSIAEWVENADADSDDYTEGTEFEHCQRGRL